METVSLCDLLIRQGAPELIDYFSLDVEGHELEVLKGLLPGSFRFRCITVEHNEPHQGPEHRDALRKMLGSMGYRFVKGNEDVQNWGHGPIDDFYVIDDPDLLGLQARSSRDRAATGTRTMLRRKWKRVRKALERAGRRRPE